MPPGARPLPQLATLLKRCHWAVGADTGPLHLATAVGTQAMGFYFSRARVHETGPYGQGHWVWQADRALPETWPIRASVNITSRARHSVATRTSRRVVLVAVSP